MNTEIKTNDINHISIKNEGIKDHLNCDLIFIKKNIQFTKLNLLYN